MNIQAYIESGILQEYCLGLLSPAEKAEVEANCLQYPELQAELHATQASLNGYAAQFAHKPDPALKNIIWNLLENANAEEKGLAAKPVLNRFADRKAWLKMVEPVLPKTLEQDLFVEVIRHDEQITQLVMWSKIDIPDETHTDELECFLILEGECECQVGENLFRLGPGDFFEIPLYEHHDVKVISPQVLAVVQRKKIA